MDEGGIVCSFGILTPPISVSVSILGGIKIMSQKPVRANLRTIHALWEKMIPFEGSNIKGVEGAYSGTGQMPPEIANWYLKDRAEGIILFTVVSYSTPIAWVCGKNGNPTSRVYPAVRYSQTTTKQQNKLQYG